ncbi:hypothetical protein ACFVGP_09085 [Streptomyces rochei]|uniref:hypothetical protein n=1 Tax=Streptomyces rochei TaxID=1928 RepID=UPI0036BFA748
MTTSKAPKKCYRRGCDFPRRPDTRARSQYTHRLECSPECSVWVLRAKWADRNDDAKEAAELMRLSALLDARRSPMEQVPGIFTKRKTYGT